MGKIKFTWWGWLCWTGAVASIAFAIWLVPERHWWATTLQVVGSAVTAYGLASAYLRSRYDETLSQSATRWVKAHWDKLFNRRRDQSVTASGGIMAATMAAPTVRITGTGLTVDETDPLSLRVAKIIVHINSLTEVRLPAIEDSIGAVKKEISRVAGDMSTMDQQTRDHIERRFIDFDERLDAKQVLDLRWAIGGLLITTLGVVLSF